MRAAHAAPQHAACSYAEFRHSQYRLVTLLWSILMGAMYLCSRNRSPHVGPIHSVLFVLVELLVISVGVSAQKGRPSHLRLAMTLLWIVRNVWYSLVACSMQGLRNEEFFPSFATISSVASLLWSAGALIHLPKPRLLVCIQACVLMCAYASSGLPLATAAAQSGAVHALSLLMYTVLDRTDRANYQKYLQGLQAAQRQARASTPKQKTCAEPGAQAEKEGKGREAACGQTSKDACSDQGVCSAAPLHETNLAAAPTDNACPGQGVSSSAAHTDHISNPVAAPQPQPARVAQGASSTTADAGPAASLDAVLKTKHARLAEGLSDPSAAPDSEKLRSSLGAAAPVDAACVGGRLHAPTAASAEPGAYRQRIRKYQVVVKLHSSLHPRDLPPSALPDFVSCMQRRMPQCAFGNAAIRAGCVLMSLDVYSLEDANKTHSCAGMAIQDWLHRYPAVLEQMPAAMPILLQVDGKATCMELDPTSKAWRSTSLSSSPLQPDSHSNPLQPDSHSLCSGTGAESASAAEQPIQELEQKQQSTPPFSVAHPSHKQEGVRQSTSPFPLLHPSHEHPIHEQEETQESVPLFIAGQQEEAQQGIPLFPCTQPSCKQEEMQLPDASAAVRAVEHLAGHTSTACRRECSTHVPPSSAEVRAEGSHRCMRVSSSVSDSSCCSSYDQLVQQLAEAEAFSAESGRSNVTASSVTASSCTTPHVSSNSPALMDSGRLGSHKCGRPAARVEPETL